MSYLLWALTLRQDYKVSWGSLSLGSRRQRAGQLQEGVPKGMKVFGVLLPSPLPFYHLEAFRTIIFLSPQLSNQKLAPSVIPSWKLRQ